MVEEASLKVQQLITVHALHNEHHINKLTERWLCQTKHQTSNSSVLHPN